MRIGWARLGLIAAGLGLVGLAVAASGIVSVAASGGHYALSGWFLHWAMQRSVTFQARGIETPRLDDPALIARGAGHYAGHCAHCHAAPGEPQSPTVRSMLPAPPTLEEKVREWRDRELFWIVKHGVTMTGMPAWPTQMRDDEVWAMAAFLRAYPGLDREGYRRAAFGEAARGDRPGEGVLAACIPCHGRDGLGRDGDAFPIIAGQTEAYLLATLRAYAESRRHSGFMQAAAGGLDARGLQEAAAHYAAQPFRPAAGSAAPDPRRIEQGRRIATHGLPSDKVPACDGCHGAGAANPAYPRIAGQHASYLRRQLALWAAGHRGGTPYAPLMDTVGHVLEPEAIEAVAAYYASLRER